mgnify:CR=1 FL=1
MKNPLIKLIDNKRSDKNTSHSYLGLYYKLLKKYKDKQINILEIGIGPYKDSNGGSIKLWYDYFKLSNIWACDIIPSCEISDELKNKERINIIIGDAYDKNGSTYNILNKNKYDIILDDGPHTLDSMIQCINLYLPLIKVGGIFIIEDIQDINWFDILTNYVQIEYKQKIKTYDLRLNKNRYDDLVFTIQN